MNQSTPFFSIIIPAYNAEKYIHCAINSIISQKFQDYELIIVDDCSTDNTLNIITDYENKYENITVIKHCENQTEHIARMNGVNLARGRYIIFLDADDFFMEGAFSILYDAIQTNPDYDFYEFGYVRQPSHELVFPSFTGAGKDRFSAYFAKDNVPAQTMWNKVYVSNLLKMAFSSMEKVIIKQGLPDIYQSIVIAYFTKRTININEIIINYTIGSGVSTVYKDFDTTVEYLNALKAVLNLVDNFLKNNNQLIDMDNIYYRFMSGTIIVYFNSQKNIEEKRKLYLMLLDYFDGKIVLEYIFNNNEILVSIMNSKDYIIGHKILQSLRKIKSFLKLWIHDTR